MDWRSEDTKRLPRGLEEVSHLFLSRAAGGGIPAAASNGRPAAPPRVSEEDSSVGIALRRFLVRDQLLALLKKDAAALEEGMRVIDVNIPCDQIGQIALLAVDCRNQLAIIDCEDSPNDGLLLRGLGFFDWIVRNTSIVRRMYQSQTVDLSLEPRLLLVAPEFSPLLRSAARRIASPRINCVRYQAVGMNGQTGVLLEHVCGA